MITNDFKEKILARADIVDVVSDVVQLKKAGSNFCAPCPFHEEKTPSFYVSPSRGTWHCFGACSCGGDVISFVMKAEGIDFAGAVKALAKRYNMEVDEKKPTPEELEKQRKKEAMLAINEAVHNFYKAALHANNPDAKAALNYAQGRWNNSESKDETRKNYVDLIEMGYAPGGNALYAFAREKNLNIPLMIELGLLRRSDSGEIYDFYRRRIMIPIRNKMRQILGFTARTLDKADDRKYINSTASELFDKSKMLFGIDVAAKAIAREEKVYLVEGAPDVIKLQSVGIDNVVAPLGGNWTEEQFELLKRYKAEVCFIPDSDPRKADGSYGAGIQYVMRNGKLAMQTGLTVKVREIPSEDGEKADPDSYVKQRDDLVRLQEESFVTWFACKAYDKDADIKVQAAAIQSIADIIVLDDEQMHIAYIEELGKLFGKKAQWKNAVNDAKRRRAEALAAKQAGKNDIDLLHKYGFYQKYNCYFSTGKDGEEKQWSNFTMQPLYHIKDSINSKRLYKIKNIDNRTEIIEMKQEELVSVQKFQQKIESYGNFIWMASALEMTRLKMYLYEKTETATEVTQLGWQKQGFFAWGNGAYYDKKMWPVDDNGIIHLQTTDDNGKVVEDLGNWYLPAKSHIYKDETKLFQFERRFIHSAYSTATFSDIAKKMVEVFGDNAKIGLCFVIASLFRDIITSYTRFFPLLNAFGPKGAGKSEFCVTLMSFFVTENIAPNIETSTIASLADTVSQCANAIVHIDEFKNSIEISKREFLKGLWDGAGRSRMNMDKDKKREMTNVDAGVIISGQEMATADIALFSRLIYLTFNKATHTREEKNAFQELLQMRKFGFTHITNFIIDQRQKFEADFYSYYNIVMNEVVERVPDDVEDRILRNWVIPLAAYKTIEQRLSLPFDYANLLDITCNGIIAQNTECRANNEIGNFWACVEFMLQEGLIFEGADFKVAGVQKLKTDKTPVGIEYSSPKTVLLLRKNRVIMLYKRVGKQVGDSVLPEGSLRYYLENSPEYLGVKHSVRFKVMRNGIEETEQKIRNNKTILVKKQVIDNPMVFDYDMLKQRYGINIEIGDLDADEQRAIEISSDIGQDVPF